MKKESKQPLEHKIIIEGVTEQGEQFRPSNWAERVGEQLSTYKKHRIQYSPLLQPSQFDGNSCLILDEQLKETNPSLYNSILEFAKSNHLKICDKDDTDEGKPK